MSPSLRGRGLKYCTTLCTPQGCRVALFTRAWIEIQITRFIGADSGSPSLRGRGLKYMIRSNQDIQRAVALFTRAWIEICVVLYVVVFVKCRPLYEGVD